MANLPQALSLAKQFYNAYRQFVTDPSDAFHAQSDILTMVQELHQLASTLSNPEFDQLANQIQSLLGAAEDQALPRITTLLRQASSLLHSQLTTGSDERKVQEVQALATNEGLEQIGAENARIDRSVQRQRMLPQIITGERVLRTRLEYDDGIRTILTRRERRNNVTFMAKFNNPLDGIGGVGNQQPLPFEVAIPADNTLLDATRHNDDIRFSGPLFDSGAYVRKKTFPSQRLLDAYHVSMIRKTPVSQAWIPKNVSAVPPGGKFVFKRTNDLAPPSVLRASPDNRLLFQTFVDGKWT